MSDLSKVKGPGARGYGLWAAIALAVLAAVTVVYLQGGGAGKGGPATLSPVAAALAGLNKGEMAAFIVNASTPDISQVAFKDAEGKDVRLGAWHGKVVLVNIWATWCVPCRKELPALDKLQAELGGKDFEVIALATDRGGLDKPRKFWTDTGIKSLALYADSNSAQRDLGVIGLPTTLLVDRQGREVGRLIGPAEWASPDAMALVQAAMKS